MAIIRSRRSVAAALLTAAVALLLLALVGCGAAANTAKVEFSGLVLHPQVLTVPVGTTVTWVNKDPEPHTVTSLDAKVPDTALQGSPQPNVLDSGPIEPGASFSFTFDTPGTYKYADLIDGYIQGKVIVQ